MIGRVPARVRLAVVTALGLGLAVVAHAQENNSTEGGATASRDAIADAKKDFDKIKSARDATLIPGSSQLPRVSVPELSLPATPSATIAPKSKTPTRETKSANWLVDAMEKQSSSRDSKGLDSHARDRKSRTGSQGEAGLEADREAQLFAESDEGKERREQKEAPESKPAVSNPLTAYLGDWMTPQDYMLLKPGLTPDLETGAAPKNLVAPSAVGVGVPASGIAAFSFGVPTAPTKALPQPPRENPFLQSLKPDLPIAADVVKSVISPPVSAAPRASVTTAPPPPTPTKIPDFARLPEDDRYFKQLKRF